MMFGMCFFGALNFLHAYFGTHEIKNAKFELTNLDMFTKDKYYDE